MVNKVLLMFFLNIIFLHVNAHSKIDISQWVPFMHFTISLSSQPDQPAKSSICLFQFIEYLLRSILAPMKPAAKAVATIDTVISLPFFTATSFYLLSGRFILGKGLASSSLGSFWSCLLDWARLSILEFRSRANSYRKSVTPPLTPSGDTYRRISPDSIKWSTASSTLFISSLSIAMSCTVIARRNFCQFSSFGSMDILIFSSLIKLGIG